VEPGSLTVVQPTLYRKLDSAPAHVDLLSQHDGDNCRFPLDLGLHCTVAPSIRYGVRLDIRAAPSPTSAR